MMDFLVLVTLGRRFILALSSDEFKKIFTGCLNGGLQRDILARDAVRKTKPTDLHEPQSADFAG
jgi:hypothetical protein